jgi:hypothetical protein
MMGASSGPTSIATLQDRAFEIEKRGRQLGPAEIERQKVPPLAAHFPPVRR